MAHLWNDFWAKLSGVGWSQRYFADQVGIRSSTVSEWRRKNRVPTWAIRFMREIEDRSRIAAVAGRGLKPPKGKPRGRFARRSGAWERSATDSAQQAPDADYRKRLGEWEESDMDQDSGEYGRG